MFYCRYAAKCAIKHVVSGRKDGIRRCQRRSFRRPKTVFERSKCRLFNGRKPCFVPLEAVVLYLIRYILMGKKLPQARRFFYFESFDVHFCVDVLTCVLMFRLALCHAFMAQPWGVARCQVRLLFVSLGAVCCRCFQLKPGFNVKNTVVHCHNVRVRVCIFPCFFLLFLCKSTTFA